MAPEQAQGRPLDGRADIYALGALLYHCLTGVPPYRGASFVEIAEQHLRAPVPDVQVRCPDAPDGVAAIVSRSLAKRPEDRYANVGEMQAALEAELLALTRDDGSDTAEVPLVATALEVAEPGRDRDPAGRPAAPACRRGRRGGRATHPRHRRRLWPIALLVLVLVRGRRLGRLPRQQPRWRGSAGLDGTRRRTTTAHFTRPARRQPRRPPGVVDDLTTRATTRMAMAATATSTRTRPPTRRRRRHHALAHGHLPRHAGVRRLQAGRRPDPGGPVAGHRDGAGPDRRPGAAGRRRVYTAPARNPPADLDGWTPVSDALRRAHGADGHPADGAARAGCT